MVSTRGRAAASVVSSRVASRVVGAPEGEPDMMQSRWMGVFAISWALVAGCGGSGGGDPCDPAASPCDPVATCTASGGSAVCTCPGGYDDTNGDGSVCSDVDECTADPSICPAYGECWNTVGSYDCMGVYTVASAEGPTTNLRVLDLRDGSTVSSTTIILRASASDPDAGIGFADAGAITDAYAIEAATGLAAH